MSGSGASAIVIGEALVDVVIDDGIGSARAGGSPANVALGLARLGVPTVLHTSLGKDSHGQLVAQHLAGSGVRITEESWNSPRTSTATARIRQDGSASYRFDISWAPEPVPNQASRLFHTGSIASVLDPGARIVLESMEQARDAGTVVSFDPNVRPELIGDVTEARSLLRNLIAHAEVVKMSDEDAALIFPGLAPHDVLDAVLDLGPTVAAVTLGDRGSVLAGRGSRVSIDPVPVRIADTIGAGDSYMAALLWSLIFRDDTPMAGLNSGRLSECGALASRAAAYTVERHGANLPSLAVLTGGGTF